MDYNKYSGVLCHPTSFPSAYGIGDLGEGATDFIDFLVRANQRLWQILPTGPTSFGDSPYQSFSSFAGNHLLISFDILQQQGYLTKEDLQFEDHFDPRKIDYGRVIQFKNAILRKAFAKHDKQDADFINFCKLNANWLDDYALFVALKDYFIKERQTNLNKQEFNTFKKKYGKILGENTINDYYFGAVWSTWPTKLVNRDKIELKKYLGKLSVEIEFYKFLQYHFYKQWTSVKKYANANNVQIIGDIPIFVAYDSCDVWANKSIFTLNADGFPTKVAGVPPDYFSETGQLWGNPLYDWTENKKTGFSWWINRIQSTFNNIDILRIDHFRGFDTYWDIPFGAKNAIKGNWRNGPGKVIFEAIEKKLGKLPIIAEDLGDISPGTELLRISLGFPGMKILQFAFEDTPDNMYLPNNYRDNNTTIYTGTHDNDTTLGWYLKSSDKTKDFLRRYLSVSGDDICWDFIRLANSSIAKYAIVPIQDIMGLDSYDRMNTPGVASGNWQFRYTKDMLLDEYADGLKYIADIFNRN